MRRIVDRLRYDNVVQAALAFVIGFLLVGSVVLAIGVSTTRFPDGLTAAEQQTARIRGETRGRYLADREAARRAADYVTRQVDTDLADVLKTGSHDSGYALAHDHAWNDAVDRLARRVPRQLLANEEHTQWIELLR